MVIDSKGKMFEDRRKKKEDRRVTKTNVEEDKRKQKTDRRNPKNNYKP